MKDINPAMVGQKAFRSWILFHVRNPKGDECLTRHVRRSDLRSELPIVYMFC